jgi:hypothetical protein
MTNITRKIAAEQQLTLVDMRKEFDDYEKINNTANVDRGLLTARGVYFNETGSQFVAKLMAGSFRKTP